MSSALTTCAGRPNALPASGAEMAFDQMDDGQLMAAVRAGEEEAFAVLVRRHKGMLVNYLAKLVRCRDRAEDLAQETFVRLYQTASRYREQGAFAGYLFRIATNLVRSEERRKKRWALLQPLLRPAESEVALVEDHYDRRQTVDLVRAALLELPLHYRAPLVLREIEGLTYAEIAAALGCREGTVKSRIHRGKNDLKYLLERLSTARPVDAAGLTAPGRGNSG